MKKISFLFASLIISLIPYAQVAISTDGTQPDASAALDVKSNTRGLLMPRMTTAQRMAINAPANGLMVYDITTNSQWYNRDGVWTELGIAAGESGTNNQGFTNHHILYNTGSQSFIVPAGVTRLYMQLWSAGGAGYTKTSYLNPLYVSEGGGGGGGAYMAFYLDVTPGFVFNFIIPKGPDPGSTQPANPQNLICSYGAMTVQLGSGTHATASATGIGGQNVGLSGITLSKVHYIRGTSGLPTNNNHSMGTYSNATFWSYNIQYGSGGSPAYYHTGAPGGNWSESKIQAQTKEMRTSPLTRGLTPGGGGAAPYSNSGDYWSGGGDGMVIISY